VLHEGLRVLGLGRVVEVPVGVDALVTGLQNGVPQHVLGRGVPVLPDQGHPLRVLVLERARLDRASVRAAQTELRGPATEVGRDSGGRMHQAVLRRRVTEVQSGMLLSHFDCSFRLLDLRRS
jgi:hypothetical protein